MKCHALANLLPLEEKLYYAKLELITQAVWGDRYHYEKADMSKIYNGELYQPAHYRHRRLDESFAKSMSAYPSKAVEARSPKLP